MTPLVAGGLVGALAALGALIAVIASPPMRPVRLDDRLAPYLRDSPRPSRLLGHPRASGGPVGQLLAPIVADAGRWVAKLSGGQGSVRRRLAVLGDHRSVEEFRTEQVLWAALGLAGGLLATGVLALAGGRLSLLSALPLGLGGACAGALARDWWLSQEVARHERSVLAEFPVVAELLALAVTAGEGPTGAIERVCTLTGGALAVRLGDALACARAGTPLVQALQQVADSTTIEPLARFVDGIVVAIERGTPLADVLRAQAADVREAGKRKLLEEGGKKEIGMMVPIVFMVLPVTVLFALFPGFISIETLAR